MDWSEGGGFCSSAGLEDGKHKIRHIWSFALDWVIVQRQEKDHSLGRETHYLWPGRLDGREALDRMIASGVYETEIDARGSGMHTSF